MTDLYFKTFTEEDMVAALLEAKVIGYAKESGPFAANYSDRRINLRDSFDDDQIALLTPFSVSPTIPYCVWA